MDFTAKQNWLSQGAAKLFVIPVRKVVTDLVGGLDLGSRVRELLVLDLEYALVRNLKWVKDKFFAEVLADYLCAGYSLPRSLCDALVVKTCAKLQHLNPHTNTWSDDDSLGFLQQMFLAALSETDPARLSLRYGIGLRVFSKIRSALRSAENFEALWNDKDQNSAVFLSDLDHKFVEMIRQLARDYKTNPLALEVTQLRLWVREFSPEDQILFQVFGLERLLTLLQVRVAPKLFDATESVQILLHSEEIEAVEAVLVERGWIERRKNASKKFTEVNYFIHDDVVELISPSIARRFWGTINITAGQMSGTVNESPKFGFWEELKKVPLALHSRVMANIGQKNQDELVLLQNLSPLFQLSPGAISGLFTALLTKIENPLVAEFTEAFVEAAAKEKLSPAFKVALCKVLSGQLHLQPVRHYLNFLAESDSSESVSAAALGVLG